MKTIVDFHILLYRYRPQYPKINYLMVLYFLNVYFIISTILTTSHSKKVLVLFDLKTYRLHIPVILRVKRKEVPSLQRLVSRRPPEKRQAHLGS